MRTLEAEEIGAFPPSRSQERLSVMGLPSLTRHLTQHTRSSEKPGGIAGSLPSAQSAR